MKKNKNLIFNIIVFIIWIILVLILINHHENWRDEAQAWFIANDLDLIDIFKQLKYEGHPILWYLILFPFTKLGFKYYIINYISAFFVSISIYLILFKTNLSKILKLLICFSPGLLYFFPVIARNTCLIPSLIIGIALLHNKKNYIILYNILIFLLLNTHLLTVPFCLILILIEFLELIKSFDSKKLIGLIIAILGVLFLYMQISGCLEMNYQVIKSFNIPPLIKSIILWLIISLITYFLSKDKLKFKYCITMFISSIGFYFIHNYTGLLSIQKEMILSLFIIITFLWINSKKSKIFLVFCFIMLFFPNYSDILDDLQLNYSSSKETTQFIKENISTDEDIVVINDYHITSLAGYAPEYNFINIFQNNNKNKFISWSKERKLKVNEFSFSHDQCSYINNLINQNEYYLVIEQNYFNLFYCEDFHLIYKSPPCIRGNENYFIYYVTVNK